MTIIRDPVGVLKDHRQLHLQQKRDDFMSAAKMAGNEMYTRGCIFNDHASGYVHIEFQMYLMGHETLMAEENFKLMCHHHFVIPQSYLYCCSITTTDGIWWHANQKSV
jgi:hypothetical protein